MGELTQKRLKELLNYNSETGVFKWITTKYNLMGQVSGCMRNDGYIMIGIGGIVYYAHRLAWLYVYGYSPEHGIDHIDRIRNHNWISNLREASTQCNMRNTGNFSHNISGVKGVYLSKYNKWAAQIKVNRKMKFLGYYNDFIDAACARLATEQCLNWEGCDNSSPAYKYVKENIKPIKPKKESKKEAKK